MRGRSRFGKLVASGALVLLATVAAGAAPAGGAVPYGSGLVAFVRCCGAVKGVWTVRPNGGGLRLLYRAAHDDAPLTPAWSPDGRALAVAPGAPRGGIWLLRANGTGLRRVTGGLGDSLFPNWSTGGTSLVFADRQSARSSLHDIFRVNVNGSGLTRLTRSPADETEPAWAPNDRAIAYVRGRDVWTMRTDGSRQRLLLRNASSPSWSPGGTHLAFVRGGDPWVAAANGSGARRVARLPQAAASVAWSPDGRLLVVAPVDRGDLVLVRTDGSSVVPLTRTAGEFHAWPAWQRTAAS